MVSTYRGFLAYAAALAVALLVAVGCGDDSGTGGGLDGGPPETCSDGVLSDGETDVDCGGACGGCAVRKACEVDADCASSTCRIGTCREADTCDDSELTAGETDIDCGGPSCMPCSLGEGCVDDEDCTTGNCNEGMCIAECDDGIQNGSETGLDCGGGCSGCPDDSACDIPGDCLSGLCVDDVCVPPSCMDRTQNGQETDVDCGGDECDPCPGGGVCEEDDDCVTRTCQMGMCAADTCVNDKLDPGETDIDCGGDDCNGCLPGDACEDSNDCIGSVCQEGVCTTASSCLGLLEVDPELPSGVYTLDREGDSPVQVYCDMETDGGGWTLVGSSTDNPPGDLGERYFPELATLDPDFSTRGIWEGLRGATGRLSDLRFACNRQKSATEFDVDLAFYQNDFYDRITAEEVESAVCFNAGDDPGFVPPPPARRNLLTGEFLRSTDPYEQGALRGERTCDSSGDFTVDFDDGGVGGVVDGTDWGQVDRNNRCGTAGFGGGEFFVFFREQRPSCTNGVQDENETGVDCGGECGGCPNDGECVLDGDCQSFFCEPTILTCLDTCTDGARQAGESDIDCGGVCDTSCQARQTCYASPDCEAPLGCLDGLCLGEHCDNALVDGSESDVDCGGTCLLCGLDQSCNSSADCGIGTCNEDNICFAPLDCQGVLDSNPGATSGIYTIQSGGELFDVYCDMEADGGGWTHVGSNGIPLTDLGASYYSDLASELSSGSFFNRGMWNAFRDLYEETADVRFTCRLDRGTDAPNEVDLSFYNVDWYHRTTAASTDAGTCFFTGGDAFVRPARRDNIGAEFREEGDSYNSGVFEGEDFCGDTSDFTVDFDDRGKDSNQGDGTDWGEDDGRHKCGTSGFGFGSGQWSVWVRPATVPVPTE
jgi:hypothetical protein